MARFTMFHKLPVELRTAIWEYSMPKPEPEVCIVWPLAIQYWKAEKPVLPFMVDTAWPAIAHVCRDARAILLNSRLVQLRYSQVAGFDVPCREFDPCIDILYWNRDQVEVMEIFFKEPQNADLMYSLRYIAIELGIHPSLIPMPLLQTKSTFTRTVAFVVPNASENYSFRDGFLPPARRFKLRDVPEDRLEDVTYRNVPYRTEDLCATQSLQQVIQALRERLDDAVRRPHIPGEDSVLWDPEDMSTVGLDIKIQSFVEYKTGEWVEVCGNRKLGRSGEAPQVRLIPPGDWKNPRGYRVLDDDCGRYPHSEEPFRE